MLLVLLAVTKQVMLQLWGPAILLVVVKLLSILAPLLMLVWMGLAVTPMTNGMSLHALRVMLLDR
ncbi:hypothetical protein D3C84_1124390 [compost metagenome]